MQYPDSTAGMHREHGASVEAAADPGLHPGAVGQPQPRPPPEAEGARRQDARAPQDQGRGRGAAVDSRGPQSDHV